MKIYKKIKEITAPPQKIHYINLEENAIRDEELKALKKECEHLRRQLFLSNCRFSWLPRNNINDGLTIAIEAARDEIKASLGEDQFNTTRANFNEYHKGLPPFEFQLKKWVNQL